MKKLFISFIAGISIAASATTPVYLDDSKPIEDRVEEALSRRVMRERALENAMSMWELACMELEELKG